MTLRLCVFVVFFTFSSDQVVITHDHIRQNRFGHRVDKQRAQKAMREGDRVEVRRPLKDTCPDVAGARSGYSESRIRKVGSGKKESRPESALLAWSKCYLQPSVDETL